MRPSSPVGQVMISDVGARSWRWVFQGGKAPGIKGGDRSAMAPNVEPGFGPRVWWARG